MTLGIFLALGDSFGDMAKTGQDDRFKKFYLSRFSKNFTKIYIFSYANEKVNNLPQNVELIPNKYSIHRYIYGITLPFINIKYVLKCNVFRAYHLPGTIPAIISKIIFLKPFSFNWAYDYLEFAKIENKKIQEIFFKLLAPIAIFTASKIFAANKTILKQLPKYKTVYLPNGVDTDFFKPSAKKNKNKLPIILSVGRLEKQKNFENLISSLEGINAQLIIIGSGSLKLSLINLAKLKKVNLKIINKVPNTQMPKFYNSADIFALASIIEGSPKSLLEAMSCGLAVIATKIQGNQDIIKNNKNGLLTYSTDFSKKIVNLISNRGLCFKLGKFAREEIKSNYNLSNLIKKEIKTIRLQSF